MRKKLFIFTILVLVTISNTSCIENKKKSYDLFERHEQEIALKNGISQINEIEIGLDSVGNSLWKRTAQIKYYNDKGLLTKIITPSYLTSPEPENSSAVEISLDEIFYNMQISRTNIPSGKIDTTYYSYDDKENLISTKDKYYTTIYKYDENNNEIEMCLSSEYSEMVCNSKKYSYDKNGHIITRIDSTGATSTKRGRKINYPTNKIFFKYDNEGRIIYDGEFKRIFNNKGQLIKVIEFKDSIEGDEYVFSYNDEGNRSSGIFTKITSRSRDTKNVITHTGTSTKKYYFYYNEKGLLRQEKVLDKKDKLVSLKNFEYIFK